MSPSAAPENSDAQTASPGPVAPTISQADPSVHEAARALQPYPTPLRWAVIGITGAAIVITAWLFALQAATQPVGQGLLVPPQGLSSIVAPADGLVQQLTPSEGSAVQRGEQVGVLVLPQGGTTPIISEFSGEFVGGRESVGAAVQAGQAIAQVVSTDTGTDTDTGSPSTGRGETAQITEVTVLVPVSQAKSITEGTTGQVELKEFPAAQFGAIPFVTKDVYRLPLAQSELSSFYGGSQGLVREIDVTSEAVRPVLIALATDPGTPSGYAWTFGSGPPSQLPLASQLVATFDIGSQRLIETPGAATGQGQQ